MRRREVIMLLGGAAAWPLAAQAQAQLAKPFRLGYLEAGARADPVVQNLRRQFLLGLRDLGYLENRHFVLAERNADGELGRLPALAIELVRAGVDIIATGGEAAIRAAQQATDTIPIVMWIAADPVGSGFVASLNRPGGNITGMSALASHMGKQARGVAQGGCPARGANAVLWNPGNRSKVEEWKDTGSAAANVGLALRSVEARTGPELDAALAPKSSSGPHVFSDVLPHQVRHLLQ